jgi:DNA-binding transcriptional LysR family regulator
MEVRIVELAQPVLESQLIAGQFDFSILLVSNLNTGLDLEHETLIRSSRKLWVHPEHPLLAREQISLADVAREDYILLDMDEHVQTVGKYWGRFKLRPKVTYQSHSIEAVRSLVALGHGATILSDLVYRPWSLEGQRIVRRSITEDIPSMDVGIAWMGGRELSAPAKRVMEFLRSSMRQISERVY